MKGTSSVCLTRVCNSTNYGFITDPRQANTIHDKLQPDQHEIRQTQDIINKRHNKRLVFVTSKGLFVQCLFVLGISQQYQRYTFSLCHSYLTTLMLIQFLAIDFPFFCIITYRLSTLPIYLQEKTLYACKLAHSETTFYFFF